MSIVISKIELKFVAAFLESVTKKEYSSISPIVTLKNGNQIQEEFIKEFHPGDYEFMSLSKIKGTTRRVA